MDFKSVDLQGIEILYEDNHILVIKKPIHFS